MSIRFVSRGDASRILGEVREREIFGISIGGERVRAVVQWRAATSEPDAGQGNLGRVGIVFEECPAKWVVDLGSVRLVARPQDVTGTWATVACPCRVPAGSVLEQGEWKVVDSSLGRESW